MAVNTPPKPPNTGVIDDLSQNGYGGVGGVVGGVVGSDGEINDISLAIRHHGCT